MGDEPSSITTSSSLSKSSSSWRYCDGESRGELGGSGELGGNGDEFLMGEGDTDEGGRGELGGMGDSALRLREVALRTGVE
jgi:hypothetical protein